jgi:hypothetical protein
MRSRIRLSVILTNLALLALAAPASAQEATRLPEGSQQSLGLDSGLEHAFIARATYAHRVDLGFWQDARLYARFTLPFVAPDFGDWGIDGGLRVTPLARGNLRLALLANPVLRNTVTDSFTATSLGVGATALLGYESETWGLSAELGYEQMVTTYIKSSALYRDKVYADAKNGWYAVTGASALVGVRGGARFGALELFARAGVNTTGELGATNPPFYVTLGSSYAF